MKEKSCAAHNRHCDTHRVNWLQTSRTLHLLTERSDS